MLFQNKINFNLLTWILNYALTPTLLNTRPTHTEREKRVNAPTTLPLSMVVTLITPPRYPHSLKPFPSLNLPEHIRGAGGRDSIKYPGK